MRRILFLLAFSYLIVIAMLMFFENKLIYPAPRLDAGNANQSGAEEVFLESSDGTRLHGWYFENARAQKTLVFFHGNAECVATSGEWLGRLAKRLNVNALIFDYRGYGQSSGKPNQKGVVEDGRAAVEWAAKRAGCSKSELVFLGRSLGGGVAVQVAADDRPTALILVSTFPSLVEVAAQKLWWVPVRTVMRNRFDSTSILSMRDIPMLQIHGGRDQLIPVELARKLFDGAKTTSKTWKVAAGCGHNDLEIEDYLEEIDKLIAGESN